MTALPAPLAPARPASEHPAAVYLASLAPGSRRSQRQALELAAQALSGGRCGAEDLPWAGLGHEHLAALKADLAARYAPATCNRVLAAVRGTLWAAWRLGHVSTDRYHRAADVAGVKGSRLPAGRALDDGELRRLIAVCGPRDAALVGLAAGGGLRRSEVVAADLADLGPGGRLLVRGKGRRERAVYLAPWAAELLDAWLAVRGRIPGPLVCRADGGRMSDQAAYMALGRRGREAGLTGFSPHDLRRTFITRLLGSGADLLAVQRLAGHARPETTARYDRRPDAEAAAATARWRL